MPQNKRVALIGGASRGLGFATAQNLAAREVRVVISGRDQAGIEAAAESIRVSGGEAVGVPADFGNPDDIDALVESALAQWGRVDVLVNNTGGPPPGGFDDVDDKQWQQAFDQLFMSTVRLYRHLLPPMRERGWGRIVNIASLSVLQPMDGLILSNAIRGAVQGLAKSLANEVAADGVTINSVCPGFTATERVRKIAQGKAEASGISESEAWKSLSAGIPAGRIGDPGELAGAVAWLVSEEAQFVNGAAIPVDGGANRSFV